MKRIATSGAFVALAFLAYACAHLEVHLGAPHAPIAAWQAPADDPIVSIGIDGGRPPASHVDD